jgi:hypothetical protein
MKNEIKKNKEFNLKTNWKMELERERVKNEGADETPNLLVIDNTRYVVCTLPRVEQNTFHKKKC